MTKGVDSVRVTQAIAALSLLGAVVTAWVAVAADNADTKRRVTSLEQQHAEQKQEQKQAVQELKKDVNDVKQDVQTVLRKLDTLEALQRAQERRTR